MCCLVGAVIGIYYMILISWIGIYLGNTGNAVKLSKCNNEWNNLGNSVCYVGVVQKMCKGLFADFIDKDGNNATRNHKFFEGRCQDPGNLTMASGTEQFFT